MDWLKTPEAAAQTQGRANGRAIADSGHSCGGLEALVAGSDPRVTAVLAMNSGFFLPGTELCSMRSKLSDIDTIKVPTLSSNGGEKDIAQKNSIISFDGSAPPSFCPRTRARGTTASQWGFWTAEPAAPKCWST